MHEPKGRYLPLPGRGDSSAIWCISHAGFPRRRSAGSFDVTALVEPRVRHPARPSWSCLFMKAYALVGAEHAPLRRSLLEFPWPRLYEHPWMNCALAIERTYQGEEGVFVGIFRAPEQQTLEPAPAGRVLVQERDAGEGRLLPHGACGSARRRRRSGGSCGGAR